MDEIEQLRGNMTLFTRQLARFTYWLHLGRLRQLRRYLDWAVRNERWAYARELTQKIWRLEHDTVNRLGELIDD